MLSLLFYLNWDSQQATRQARAHFNGALAKHAQLNRGYIIRNPDIAAATDPGLYVPSTQGDLSEIGYLLKMKDIAQSSDNCGSLCCGTGVLKTAYGYAKCNSDSK